MHILLTGPNSFCGKVIIQDMLNEGHSVTTISRSSISSDFSRSINTIHGDLSKIDRIEGKYDVVVHIAATSPAPGITNFDLLRDNILATQNLISLLKDSNVQKFIFFSTLSVYGDITQAEVTENTPVYNPCVYGATKLTCEALLRSQKLFKSIAIRLPAVVGKGAARHWLATTIDKAMSGQDITIHNPHALFNNAVHIKSLSRFIVTLLDKDFTKDFDAVNVGSEGGMPILSVVSHIKHMLGSKSQILVNETGRKSFTISTKSAHEIYGFNPFPFSMTLDTYLQEFLAS